MRAGRLIALTLLLQHRGKLTASQLAVALEVSERTVLRDIEALSGSGIPVYATRGPSGGFQMLDGYTTTLNKPLHRPAAVGSQRAQALITPEGRRQATLLGRLQPLRVRRNRPAREGWVHVSFLIGTIENTIIDVLSLGPQIEIIEPVELRRHVAERAQQTAALYPTR